MILGSLYPVDVDCLEDLWVSSAELLEHMVHWTQENCVERGRGDSLYDRVVFISIDQWIMLTIHMVFEIHTISLLIP